MPAADDATLDALLATLLSKKRVLITTHVRPDGDALGSTAALHLGLKSRGIDSIVLLLSKLPSKYAFVFDGVEHLAVDTTPPERSWFDAFDAFVCVDTGTWSQLPGLEAIVPTLRVPRLVIDHHRTQGDWADQMWQDISAAAAGEMIGRLLERANIRVTRPMADAMFVAIVSDTGWLQFSNTTPATLRRVASLVEAGAQNDAIYQRLYQNERAERLFLHTRALQSLELRANNRVASTTLTADDFAQTKASVNDTEAIVNLPLQIGTVQASVAFSQNTPGDVIRISFRSKGQIDVSKFAERFGGGGHARAAGAKMNGTIEEVREKVLNAFVEAIA